MSSTTTLPGNSQFISLDKAIEMTKLYRDGKEKILAQEYKDQNILLLSETFSREAFDSLLSQPDCAGIRIYFGMDEAMTVRVIAVATNKDNADILPSADKDGETEEGDIVEQGQQCPNFCPPPSPLNE